MMNDIEVPVEALEKITDHNELSKLRTLLALERNNLARKRTRLAELRTAFSIIIFGTPSTFYTAFMAIIPIFWRIFGVIGILLVLAFGIRLAILSQLKLRKIRKSQAILQEKINKILPKEDRIQ
jgi:uncharacterized membrane protein YidH (DUF202 family)